MNRSYTKDLESYDPRVVHVNEDNEIRSIDNEVATRSGRQPRRRGGSLKCLPHRTFRSPRTLMRPCP